MQPSAHGLIQRNTKAKISEASASLLQRMLLSVAGLCADIRPLLLFSLPPQLPFLLTALISALLSNQTQVRDRLAAFREAAAAVVLGGCGKLLAELDVTKASVSEKSSKQVVHLLLLVI